MQQWVAIEVDGQRLFAMLVQGFGYRGGGAIFQRACALRPASGCGGNACDGRLLQWSRSLRGVFIGAVMAACNIAL